MRDGRTLITILGENLEPHYTAMDHHHNRQWSLEHKLKQIPTINHPVYNNWRNHLKGEIAHNRMRGQHFSDLLRSAHGREMHHLLCRISKQEGK
jgi:hypothetical protein